MPLTSYREEELRKKLKEEEQFLSISRGIVPVLSRKSRSLVVSRPVSVVPGCPSLQRVVSAARCPLNPEVM